MARNRMINKEYITHEKTVRLSILGRYLFICLWVQSDDYGVCKANAKILKGQNFPQDDDVTAEMIQECLLKMQELDMIRLFEVGLKELLFIKNFAKYQTVNRPSENRNCSEEEFEQLMCTHKLSLRTHKIVRSTPKKLLPEIEIEIEREEERENEGEYEGKRKISAKGENFTPPTEFEVLNYMIERGLDEKDATLQTEKFMSHYERVGWKVGKNKMKSWKAGVRYWLSNNNPNNNRQKPRINGEDIDKVFDNL